MKELPEWEMSWLKVHQQQPAACIQTSQSLIETPQNALKKKNQNQNVLRGNKATSIL